ncbi:T3JAM protein, partial [Formicarius rufipectus]|nr:T3JAM protein [Formicarius rufipectus]
RMPRGARLQRRRSGESYEEKCERRQETREQLRCRNNATTCRPLPRAAEQPTHSPRLREFLRRRNLPSHAGGMPPGHEPEAQIPPGCPAQVELGPSILLQVTLPPGHSSACSTRLKKPTQPPLKKPQDPNQSETAQMKRCVSVPTAVRHALSPPSLSAPLLSLSTDQFALSLQEIVQLSNYLKEALHRELLLKQKMVILQELFSTLLEASEKSWQGQLNEDKLKCKLRALENQLQACTQSYSKERVKKILIEMEDQKQTYEQKAKEALQKMLEDKLQAEQQLQNSQRSLAVMREDLAFWKEHDTALKAELTEVTTAHTELKNSFHSLQSELQRAEAQQEQLRRALQSLRSEHTALQQRASALRQDRDLRAQHIAAIQDKLQKEQEQKAMLEATISHLHNLLQNQNHQQKSQEVMVPRKDQVFTTQTPPLTPAKENQKTLLESPEEEEREESLKDEMQKRTTQLTAKEKEVRKPLNCCWCPFQIGIFCELPNCCFSLQRQRGHWIPLLVALVAVAIATFLASYRP